MTEQLWYPAAEHDPQPDSDCGAFDGGPARGVVHSTESAGYPSYKPGTHPHFTAWLDSGKPRVRQHVPINHGSSALMHPAGTPQTNRRSAIQIEIATYAAKAPQTPHALLAAVRDLMRWIEAQTGIKRHAPVFKAYPASYGVSNGVRLSDDAWAAFAGWCGHEHVPHNDHGDPGAIDITYLLSATPDTGKKPSKVTKVVHAIVVPRLAMDGVLGAKTILALQRAVKVRQTGVLDLATRRGLQADLNVAVDGVIGPATVTALQQRLRRLGHPVAVDGTWGAATTSALQASLNARVF